MAAARFFVALLLLTTAMAGLAHAEESRNFDITSATSVPRKVLNGGSDGMLVSAVSQAVSKLQGALEAIESALSLNAPVLGESNVKKLTGLDNFDKVINSGDKVVIFFTASWCPPCKFIGQIFENRSLKYTDLAFYEVDITEEDSQAIAGKVGIRAMPTVIAFKDGEKVDEVLGMNFQGLEELLARFSEM